MKKLSPICVEMSSNSNLELFSPIYTVCASLLQQNTGHFTHETSACDHYTSSTLIGTKGGAGPSSLRTTLEGPTEFIGACHMDVTSTKIPTWHHKDRVSRSLGLFSKPISWR